MVESGKETLPKGLEDARIEVSTDSPTTLEEALRRCLDLQHGDIRVFLLDKRPSDLLAETLGIRLYEQIKPHIALTMTFLRGKENAWYLALTDYRQGHWHPPLNSLKSLIK